MSDAEGYDTHGANEDAAFSESLKARRTQSAERAMQAKKWKRGGRPRVNSRGTIGSSYALELMQSLGKVIGRYNE